MSFISFKDWMKQQESSAFTRLRRDAALGLKPPISPAAVHSRSTAHPFEVEQLTKKKKKKKKKKLDEDKVPDKHVDSWLAAVDKLKAALDELKEKNQEIKSDEIEDETEEDEFDELEPEDELEDEEGEEEGESENELSIFKNRNAP